MKITDNEIIKALECCKEHEFLCNSNCPLFKDDDCRMTLPKNSLDLIKRLRAENEELVGNIDKLKAENERLKTMHSEMCIGMKRLKSEARKEFAERLKEKFKWQHVDFSFKVGIYNRTIDNLLKEMEQEGE